MYGEVELPDMSGMSLITMDSLMSGTGELKVLSRLYPRIFTRILVDASVLQMGAN